MTATDREERMADIHAQLENREGGIVSLLGRGDIDFLLTEVDRLRNVLREIDKLDTIDEDYGLIAELARAALAHEETGE